MIWIIVAVLGFIAVLVIAYRWSSDWEDFGTVVTFGLMVLMVAVGMVSLVEYEQNMKKQWESEWDTFEEEHNCSHFGSYGKSNRYDDVYLCEVDIGGNTTHWTVLVDEDFRRPLHIDQQIFPEGIRTA